VFGQDIMRGEYSVPAKVKPHLPPGGGGGCWIGGPKTKSSPKYIKNLTLVKGVREVSSKDDTSRKILNAGRKSPTAPGRGLMRASTLGPDGKFARADLHMAVDPEDGSGTSIFDPVLCELAYRWFCPIGGAILDPFAGGSVRGIVASVLGRRYTGIDLNVRQIKANEDQAGEIVIKSNPRPRWITGDSTKVRQLAKGAYDFVFSCPPYFDLEVYSDDPRDLSAMAPKDFLPAYRKIIAESCSMLADDRFACFVVGDVRSPEGPYFNLVSETIAAFESAGLRLYNEAILVTSLGSLPIRASKQFVSGRKLGKTHQNVLVFVKGDWRKAVAACGEINVEFGDPTRGFDQ